MNKIITYKNSFIVQKELRKLINILKENIFNNNGLLFGDIVANFLIIKYHKKIFEKKINDFKNYWDDNYDVETILRTEICNKIDVYFINLNDYTKFIDFLKNSKIFEITLIKNIDNLVYINNLYEITTRLGKTLTYIGYPINVSINMLVKMPGCNNNLEPPFNNTNFLTDILLMTKNREYKISKNTGIIEIDNMNIIEKSIFYTKVLKEICAKKNHIICNNIHTISNNNTIAKKTLEYNKNEWNVINSPIILTKCSNYVINKCYICQYEINYNDNIMLIDNISKCVLHADCGNKYLENLLEKNENIICPLRQSINFITNNIQIFNNSIF